MNIYEHLFSIFEYFDTNTFIMKDLKINESLIEKKDLPQTF